jgi:hypothetical protein
MSQERHRLADGRYLVRVTPRLYSLQDEFADLLCVLPVESVELPSTLENPPPCNTESDQVP